MTPVNPLFAEPPEMSSHPASIQTVRQDFGHIVRGQATGVVQPHTVAELVTTLQVANQQGLTLTPRGQGRSQSGQAVSKNGLTLETAGLNEILFDNSQPDRVTCGAGVTWRQIVAGCQTQLRLPYVMPLNLDLSLGGTLAAGGFGANSHRYGAVIDHILSLEVVTGAGEWVSCSPQTRPDVFQAILGGLGRCGVIAAATLALRPLRPLTRTYYLLYEDMDLWLTDQQRLASQTAVDYLEGFCAASIQGLHKTPQGRRPLFHWQYGLHVGMEFAPEDSSPQDLLLNQLHHRQLLLVEEDTTVDYAARYDARFQMMRQSGAWEQPHPWFECLLPLDAAPAFIAQALALLPSFFGDGHRVLFLADRSSSDLFMRPPAPALIFAILPTAVPPEQLPKALEILAILDRALIASGGKRYLSGWLGQMTDQSWQTHYGARYEAWLQAKQKLDPNQILRSVLFP